MADKVDVLAVMRAAVDRLPDSEAAPLCEAGRAVAELVEAGKGYLDAMDGTHDLAARCAAGRRFEAALARCQP